jgi:hypothetical protein
MPIVKFVPPLFDIKDYRTPHGNYYVAKCDNCGQEFYPKRSDAKFCSKKCTLITYRINKTNDPKPKAPKKEEFEPIETVVGRIGVVNWFREVLDVKTWGLVTVLKNMDIGEMKVWEGFYVKRIKSNTYQIG